VAVEADVRELGGRGYHRDGGEGSHFDSFLSYKINCCGAYILM